MTKTESLAKIDKRLRPLITKLPPSLAVFVYSYGRKYFLSSLSSEVNRYADGREKKAFKLWGITFGSNIFNAAGMFKKGEGYELCASQGAGAYLAGTTTDSPRQGNKRKGILHPFAPYPESGAAINWMGLPNEGHETVAKRLSSIIPKPDCPIGASVSILPEKEGIEARTGLIRGLELYSLAGVHFIELNESCPNVIHDSHIDTSGLDRNLIDRLEYLSQHFLHKRQRNLPIIVKFSTDTDITLLPALIDILITLGFDGINLGNTSTDYTSCRKYINSSEQNLFEYFTSNFGGGVSGRPLKEKSYSLASAAAKYIKSKNLNREFHVIRTGGIETREDIKQSEEAGIELNQWFTGYFENFAKYGHRIYGIL